MSQIKCYFAVPIQVEADFKCEAHDHSCTELVLHINSSGWITEGKKRYHYQDGDIVIHQPGNDHWVENKKTGIHFCIGVTGAGAESLPTGVYQATEHIRQIYQQIQEELEETKSSQLEMLDFLSGILVIQLKRLVNPVVLESKMSSHAKNAKRILDTQFNEDINITEVASSLYISPDYLRQLFKATYGNSPMQYLIKKRIDYACELLQMSKQPIQDIALASGIENPYYFSRIFKKLKGCTPSEFRSKLNQ